MDELEKLQEIVALITPESQPNLNALTPLLRKIDSLSLSVKFFGYELARSLAEALPIKQGLMESYVPLNSKPSTQADIASEWVAYWCSELKIPVVFHRKVWELCYVLQAIYNHGSMHPGARGLGFGCGREPIPSYLAHRGVSVTVTDQHPDRMEAEGWARTNQHSDSLAGLIHDKIVDQDKFANLVDLKYTDMNNIDGDLQGYDFCWSICAFEHLGSIKNGIDFVENSLKTLRRGGLSVHTTEFNFYNEDATIDNWPTVLFQKRHFIEIAERLQSQGHKVAPLNFDVGSMPMDKFIDIPPYVEDWPAHLKAEWQRFGTPHLKLCVDGFPSTCFGIIVTKRS